MADLINALRQSYQQNPAALGYRKTQTVGPKKPGISFGNRLLGAVGGFAMGYSAPNSGQFLGQQLAAMIARRKARQQQPTAAAGPDLSTMQSLTGGR